MSQRRNKLLPKYCNVHKSYIKSKLLQKKKKPISGNSEIQNYSIGTLTDFSIQERKYYAGKIAHELQSLVTLILEHDYSVMLSLDELISKPDFKIIDAKSILVCMLTRFKKNCLIGTNAIDKYKNSIASKIKKYCPDSVPLLDESIRDKIDISKIAKKKIEAVLTYRIRKKTRHVK